jgi:hypothetical protein
MLSAKLPRVVATLLVAKMLSQQTLPVLKTRLLATPLWVPMQVDQETPVWVRVPWLFWLQVETTLPLVAAPLIHRPPVALTLPLVLVFNCLLLLALANLLSDLEQLAGLRVAALVLFVQGLASWIARDLVER